MTLLYAFWLSYSSILSSYKTFKERIQLDVSLEKMDMWLQEGLRMSFCCFELIEVWRGTGVIQGWSFSVEKT